jgi:hypothetical protein
MIIDEKEIQIISKGKEVVEKKEINKIETELIVGKAEETIEEKVIVDYETESKIVPEELIEEEILKTETGLEIKGKKAIKLKKKPSAEKVITDEKEIQIISKAKELIETKEVEKIETELIVGKAEETVEEKISVEFETESTIIPEELTEDEILKTETGFEIKDKKAIKLKKKPSAEKKIIDEKEIQIESKARN